MNDDTDKDEVEHWHNVMRTFLLYSDFFSLEIKRRQGRINQLPKTHQARLPSSTFDKFGDYDHAMLNNQQFFDELVRFHIDINFCESIKVVPEKYKGGDKIKYKEQHRNEAVLHSLHREWTSSGAEERASCFMPLIEQLKAYLPVTASNKYLQRVLVPGCGLARLPLEISALGYACEGNEFSAFMVMASNFILNASLMENSFVIHPWIDKTCNNVSILNTIRGYGVPDRAATDILAGGSGAFLETVVNTESIEQGNMNIGTEHSSKYIGKGAEGVQQQESDLLPFPKFSFAAGDFVETYGNANNEGQWDAVVTCFFIDTAPVVLDYIDVIFGVLKPGGLWLNIGPLLYHWAADEDGNGDDRYNRSLELTWEEIEYIITVSYGFEMLKQDFVQCTYSANKDAMMWTTYNAKRFTARKPLA